MVIFIHILSCMLGDFIHVHFILHVISFIDSCLRNWVIVINDIHFHPYDIGSLIGFINFYFTLVISIASMLSKFFHVIQLHAYD
jgi:hypothetical protein